MKNFRTEFKWSLIFSVVMLGWMYLEKTWGWHDEKIAKHALNTLWFGIPALIVYFFALRDKRETDLGGKMEWKQGFVSGIILSVLIAILSPLVQYIIHTYISPDYFDNGIQMALENGKTTKENAEAYFNLNSYMIQAGLGGLCMGMVTGAVVALFVKKQ
ncbi:DUF4199 domain-containing protein [Sediminicola luteus]|uniref:DUF4199 domain-containing protein n=1 Tax=Sediminicola luteus TaxID=319238 RepID=A0A2A4G4Q6_9FLAO|nr:DUF4199 domain-containing protein [Sediminicola luteus]PCE62966.1 DUF4199 domain-containing protein [Sediminicola luteus]